MFEALATGLTVVGCLPRVDTHVDPEMIFLTESPAALSALMRLLPGVSPLMQDTSSVVTKHLATETAATLDLVILLVLPPLGSLLKRLPAHGACLQLQLDVVGVEMFDESLRYRGLLCDENSPLADVAQGLEIIIGKGIKMFPQIFSPLSSALHTLLDFSGLRINDWLLLCCLPRPPLDTGLLSLELDDPDVVLTLEMTRHAGCPLVNVVHILIADDTHTLGGVLGVHRKVLPHPTPLLPCSICSRFIDLDIRIDLEELVHLEENVLVLQVAHH